MQLTYVTADKVNAVLQENNTEILCKQAYEMFMKTDYEVIYVVHEKRLIGVISIGDLWRYFSREKTDFINVHFTKVLDKQTDIAQDFLENHWTIHEVPCVDVEGGFLGVYRDSRINVNRNAFRSKLEKEFLGYSKWLISRILLFFEKTPATVFGFKLPSEEMATRILPTCIVEQFVNRNSKSPIELLKCMDDIWAKKYWGEAYYDGIGQEFVREYQKISASTEMGVSTYNSLREKHFTCVDGHRSVLNNHKEYKRTIYMIGPCTMFGAYVSDEQTIQYFFQELLDRNHLSDYNVVNWGFHGIGYELQYLLTQKINSEDIVILGIEDNNWVNCLKSGEKQKDNIKYLGDYSDVFRLFEEPLDNILDTFRHVNYRVNYEIANRLFHDIKNDLLHRTIANGQSEKIQDYFISWDVISYYKKFVIENKLDTLQGNIGAIVMNCNPFTRGHRYLVEKASKQCDQIIVFVVEEDKSEFAFCDRFEMVKRGTADIDNVVVVPSGDFIISNSTFAQYFEKANATEVASMDYDIRIFGEVVSDIIGIKYRFVGEEPFDIVTKEYNETMKRILPEYGIEVIEIPRLKEDEEVISASKVRKLLKDGKLNLLKKYLPSTTLEYLKKSKNM